MNSSKENHNYNFGGKDLIDLLTKIRNEWRWVTALWWFPELCSRLYVLVYDEWLELRDALNELGRQSEWQLYVTDFWMALTNSLRWDAALPADNITLTRNLLTQLESVCNDYLK